MTSECGFLGGGLEGCLRWEKDRVKVTGGEEVRSITCSISIFFQSVPNPVAGSLIDIFCSWVVENNFGKPQN
jgi:hypothetical protein